MTRVRWREARSHNSWWMVDTHFGEAVEALELGTMEGAERLLARNGESRGDPSGRAPTRVTRLPDSEAKLHVRRVVHGGLLAPLWIGRLAGIDRVRNELLVTAELRERGAPVPRAVLAFALRSGPLWRASIATIHIEAAPDGITFLRGQPSADRIERAADATGRAVRRFHDVGGRHRDLHLGNLLVREEDREVEAWVIDLDRCGAGQPPAEARRRHELRRLERSVAKRDVHDVVGPRGLEAFLRGYAAGG